MKRRATTRPVLLPSLRRLWRSANQLQIGTDPGRAVVLRLPGPAYAQLLDLLDGDRTETGWIRAAVKRGVTAADAAAILLALTNAGFVVDRQALLPQRVSEATRRRLDAETLALALAPGNPPPGTPRPRSTPAAAISRRAQAQILISGTGQLAVPIACALAAAGVGHLDPDLSGFARVTEAAPGGLLPSDAHRPRGVAAGEALRRTAPEVDLAPLRPAQANFAVVVGFGAPAALTALSYGVRRLPHLAVAIRDGTVVVGPLVRPGRSPCLNCLDLHRQDRDPAWPAIAAQLATAGDGPEPVAVTTVLAGAAYAAAQVLAYLDGDEPETLGATIEIPAAGRAIRRSWSLHPQCGCRRQPRARADRRRGEPFPGVEARSAPHK